MDGNFLHAAWLYFNNISHHVPTLHAWKAMCRTFMGVCMMPHTDGNMHKTHTNVPVHELHQHDSIWLGWGRQRKAGVSVEMS